MDREIYRVKHSKIKNWKILFKLFVWKFLKKLIRNQIERIKKNDS
jgi:hypothetical protein